MSLYRHIQTLIETRQPTTADQTSPSFLILPSELDRIEDPALRFSLFVDVAQSGGSGSPGVTVQVETSHSGATWIPVISPVVVTSSELRSLLLSVDALGPFVRARSSLTGSTKPEHLVIVKLASNGSFRLLPQPPVEPLPIGGTSPQTLGG